MKESTIFSIGHGNKSVEQVISELRSFNIVVYSLTKGKGTVDLFGEETTLMSRKEYA